MNDLSVFHNESFDIVLSSFGIGYVKNMERTFQEVLECWRKRLFVLFKVNRSYHKVHISILSTQLSNRSVLE